MGKEKDISPTKLGLIQGYLSSGNHSNRQIAKCVNVSRATVDRIKRKLDNNQSLKLNKRKNCGQIRITTPRTERKIRDIVIENRRKSKKVLKEIINNEGITIYFATLRRRMAEQGFKACRPAKKPRLTQAMKDKRLQWAKNHRHFTTDDWERVCFSDESTLEILMDKTNFVRRRTGEMFNEDCLVERVKHPLKIMVWDISKNLITNKRDLIEKLINVWHHSEEIKKNCQNLIKSMTRRVEAVIAAKGGHTKY
ncbi:uncharacterized protein LOC136075411 [Hydra vulgaris]|uniref:Uncharacterized protein LOC136075411 n=1 Tax=Hydra vulgaris TaxID=6087 RepID=A0ABM4B6U3_HYDVU